MPVYVEVWCEKDALAGVLLEETEPYDVPLMVAKGYSSISFLHSAADIALQFGVPLEVIRKALMRDSHGRSRTPLGAALDKIAADQA